MNKVLKRIIGFSIKNRNFILFCSLILVVAGIITYKNMPIEAFPDVTNTEISIITQWPGRSAEEVEKFITIPIEIAMNPVQRKASLRSTSIFGLSYVKLIFDDDVKDPEARQQSAARASRGAREIASPKVARYVSATASRIAARSTMAGTPVKSCISTRAGR